MTKENDTKIFQFDKNLKTTKEADKTLVEKKQEVSPGRARSSSVYLSTFTTGKVSIGLYNTLLDSIGKKPNDRVNVEWSKTSTGEILAELVFSDSGFLRLHPLASNRQIPNSPTKEKVRVEIGAYITFSLRYSEQLFPFLGLDFQTQRIPKIGINTVVYDNRSILIKIPDLSKYVISMEKVVAVPKIATKDPIIKKEIKVVEPVQEKVLCRSCGAAGCKYCDGRGYLDTDRMNRLATTLVKAIEDEDYVVLRTGFLYAFNLLNIYKGNPALDMSQLRLAFIKASSTIQYVTITGYVNIGDSLL